MKKMISYECEICNKVFPNDCTQHEEICKWEKEGHAVWVEDGKVKHAPKVPSELFGSHNYRVQGTSNCRYECGCWAGDSRSGGPVDPFGPCPKNYSSGVAEEHIEG